MENKGLKWLRKVELAFKQESDLKAIVPAIKWARPFMRYTLNYRVKKLLWLESLGVLSRPKLALIELLLLAHETDYHFRYNPEMNKSRQSLKE